MKTTLSLLLSSLLLVLGFPLHGFAQEDEIVLDEDDCKEYAVAYGQYIALNDIGQISGLAMSLAGIGIQGIGAGVTLQADSRAWTLVGGAIIASGATVSVSGQTVNIAFANDREAKRAFAGAILSACANAGHI